MRRMVKFCSREHESERTCTGVAKYGIVLAVAYSMKRQHRSFRAKKGPKNAPTKTVLPAGATTSVLDRLLSGDHAEGSAALSEPVTNNAVPGTLSATGSMTDRIRRHTAEHGTISLWRMIPWAFVLFGMGLLITLAWSWVKKAMGGQP